MQKIKILLVDDHNLLVYSLSSMLKTDERFEIVGMASNGLEAIKIFENTNPDVILMDINMPEMNGIETTKKIKESNSTSKVIMLTTHHEEAYILKSDLVGADGYLFKNCDMDELFEAIVIVNQGEKYYSKKISPDLISKILKRNYTQEELIENELTKREIEIIKAISEGLNNKEISEKLFISDRTVNTHRTNIMNKLNAKNSVDLVVKAIEKKII